MHSTFSVSSLHVPHSSKPAQCSCRSAHGRLSSSSRFGQFDPTACASTGLPSLPCADKSSAYSGFLENSCQFSPSGRAPAHNAAHRESVQVSRVSSHGSGLSLTSEPRVSCESVLCCLQTGTLQQSPTPSRNSTSSSRPPSTPFTTQSFKNCLCSNISCDGTSTSSMMR